MHAAPANFTFGGEAFPVIRRDFSGRRWLADCFAFDGYEWTLDARTSPATLADTRATVRTWCEAIDRHAHNCRLPN